MIAALFSRSWRFSSAACAFTLCALVGGAPALATNDPSPLATGSIPANLLVLFQQASAASPCGVPWTLLAAVAKTESSFDATAVSECRCRGHVPVRAGDLRRLRQADPARRRRAGHAVRPDRRRLCRGALPVLARGRRTTRPWRWWRTTAATPDRRARPRRPATPKRCWPRPPATPRRVESGVGAHRAVSKRPPSPTPSPRSARPTSTAATTPQSGFDCSGTGGVGLRAGRGGRAPGGQRPVARRAPRGAE